MTGNLSPVVDGIPPNPGGALPPEHVIGRDALITEYWRLLERQSLALFAPRRVGKTSIMVRMAADPPPMVEVRTRDLEGLTSAPEFARALFEDVDALLGTWQRTATRTRTWLSKLVGSVEIKDFKLDIADQQWQRLIEEIFVDLDETLGERGHKLVIMWDEFTLFVGDLILHGRAPEAMVLLDTLRRVRQKRTHVRMLFTGSIGIHEVLRQLEQDHGYRNRPFNDADIQRVPMLDEAGATQLVLALFQHANVPSTPELVGAVVSHSEGHPFVIQHLADRLSRIAGPETKDVEQTLSVLLRPPGDPLDLSHYVQRLGSYYDRAQAKLAFEILDAVAVTDGIAHRELIERFAEDDRDSVRDVIKYLEQDFYLRRTQDQRVEFLLGFIRRFWVEERVL